MKELDIRKITAAGVLIALGIVFGDLRTSPLYGTCGSYFGFRVIINAISGLKAIYILFTFRK